MAYLLTWSGTLLCRHRHSGALLHRAIAPDMGDLEPIVLDLPTEQLQPGFGHHLRATLPDLPASASGMLQRFRPQWAEDQRTITLQHDDAFLTAAPHDDGISMVPGAPGGWQTFLPLSAADLDALRTILAASWLVRSSGELVERPTLGALFHLHVGGLAVDLRYQLPFDHAHWPNRLTLLRDGWRIDQICRYQPLVYYSAFGSPDHLEQFAVSVRSLIEFGRYQGPILALTDQTPAGMAGYLAPEDWPGSHCCSSSRTTGPASWPRAISSLTGRRAGPSSRCSTSMPTRCSTTTWRRCCAPLPHRTT